MKVYSFGFLFVSFRNRVWLYSLAWSCTLDPLASALQCGITSMPHLLNRNAYRGGGGGGQRQSWVSFFRFCSPCVLRQDLFQQIKLDWLASESHGSTCLYIHITGIKSACHHVQPFYVATEALCQLSCLPIFRSMCLNTMVFFIFLFNLCIHGWI